MAYKSRRGGKTRRKSSRRSGKTKTVAIRTSRGGIRL